MNSIYENGKEVKIFEPWYGCSKVSPGCHQCAMGKNGCLDERNDDNLRGLTSDEEWEHPLKWYDEALHSNFCQYEVYDVYAGYFSDWADENAPMDQRKRLWNLIHQTPMYLDWRLVTKRAENIKSYLPYDWGTGYPQVSLGVSIEDKKHGLPRIDILRNIPAARRIVECRPLLEDLGKLDLTGIYSVSVRPESGSQSRPMESEWVLNIHRQCLDQGVLFSTFSEDRFHAGNPMDAWIEKRDAHNAKVLRQWNKRGHR